jgi:hypothetical protein
MDKKVIKFTPLKKVGFGFPGQNEDYFIEVRPYLDVAEQSELIELYLDSYFNSDNYGNEQSQIIAECAVVLYILDHLTNVEISNEDIDNVLASKLWSYVKERISNYDDFRHNLNEVIKNKKEQIALEKSVGVMVDKAVNKVVELVSNISQNTDVDKIKEVITSSLKEMEQSPMAPVFKEAQQDQVKKVRKSRKKVA